MRILSTGDNTQKVRCYNLDISMIVPEEPLDANIDQPNETIRLSAF